MTITDAKPLPIASKEEWLKARLDLLAKERQMTHAMDDLAKARRSLPMVKIDKEYRFETLDGKECHLKSLFGESKQLIVYHLMLGPDSERACTGCAAICSGLGDVEFQLRSRNTSFLAVARGDPSTIKSFAKDMNWSFPIVTTHSPSASENNDKDPSNEFNLDFQAINLPDVRPVYHNYMTAEELAAVGKGYLAGKGEMPGLTVFYKDDEGNVYHTYSTYARGLDNLAGVYRMLDLTPLGRQEEKGGNIGKFPLKIDWEAERKKENKENNEGKKEDCCS